MNDKLDGEKLFMEAYEISKNFRFSYRNGNIYIILDIVNLDNHFFFFLIELLQRIKKELI